MDAVVESSIKNPGKINLSSRDANEVVILVMRVKNSFHSGYENGLRCSWCDEVCKM